MIQRLKRRPFPLRKEIDALLEQAKADQDGGKTLVPALAAETTPEKMAKVSKRKNKT